MTSQPKTPFISNCDADAPLRIGVVAGCLNGEHVRGIGRYVHEVVQQAQVLVDADWTLYGDNPGRPMRVPQGARIQGQVFAFRGDRLHLWEQMGLPLRAQRDQLHLLHCTEGTLPWWQPVPTVVTLHDTMAWLDEPSSAVERAYWRHVQPAALHKAAAIITISKSSQRDILARWPTLADRLTVIYHGISEDCFLEDGHGPPDALARAVDRARYLVYLGGPMERKRFGWALRVLEECPERDLHLIACGFGEKDRVRATTLLPNHLAGRVHFAPFLEDSELRKLYRGAEAVLYPTLYEGFGFPVVEAHAAGVPCLFSPGGSLAELVGPLAFVAPSEDLAAWVRNLQQVLSLGERRRELAAAGRSWARQFSWRHSSEAHLDVFRDVIQRR
jgi:alpha-1,3-rhamnosyl/mannosyltransferase